MIKKVYISPKDIQRIESCSRATSYKKLDIIKKALGKKDHQKVSVLEYIDFEGVDAQTIGIEPKYKRV